MSPAVINWLMFLTLVGLWGTSFLFTAVAVEGFSPTTIVLARVAIGAVTLLIGMLVRGSKLPSAGRAWTIFLLLGFFGNLLPFFLIAWGQQHINSGIAGVIMAIMPLVTILLAHWFIEGEFINRYKLIGFVTGISGVVLLLGPVMGESKLEIFGSIAVFFAAISYAVNTILTRKFSEFGPVATGAGIMLVCTAIALPIHLITESALDWSSPSTNALLALIWLGIGPTGIAALVYFILIQRAGPTFLSNINYLIPAVAFFSGAVFLDERVELQSLFAMLVILSGIALSRLRISSKKTKTQT